MKYNFETSLIARDSLTSHTFTKSIHLKNLKYLTLVLRDIFEIVMAHISVEGRADRLVDRLKWHWEAR